MAIRYTPKYNKEIRRVVYNFNQTRKRANQAGYAKSKIPNSVKVSELKATFKNRRELNKELTRLKNFSRKSLKQVVETEGGAVTNEWNINYLKSHTNAAREHFNNRRELLEKKIKNGLPGERMALDNVESKLNILNLDLNTISEQQLKSYESTITEYLKFSNRSARGYRGFLSEVDFVMGNVGISEEDKKAFFNKFNQLTPEQFQYLYDNSDLINRIYMLVDSPQHGGTKEVTMNASPKAAKGMINTLFDEVDDLILDAKENA